MVFEAFGYEEGNHYQIDSFNGTVFFNDPTISEEEKVRLSFALDNAVKETERKVFSREYFMQ